MRVDERIAGDLTFRNGIERRQIRQSETSNYPRECRPPFWLRGGYSLAEASGRPRDSSKTTSDFRSNLSSFSSLSFSLSISISFSLFLSLPSPSFPFRYCNDKLFGDQVERVISGGESVSLV